MNTIIYHFLYYEREGDFYAKGINIEASSVEDAVVIFREKHKDCIFTGCYVSTKIIKK